MFRDPQGNDDDADEPGGDDRRRREQADRHQARHTDQEQTGSKARQGESGTKVAPCFRMLKTTIYKFRLDRFLPSKRRVFCLLVRTMNVTVATRVMWSFVPFLIVAVISAYTY